MADDHAKWCCRNGECKRMNLQDNSIVKMAEEKNKRLLMVCGTCGYVYQFKERDTTRGGNWLVCIPFMGMEKHLPTGTISSGTYEDYQGKSWSINDFIEKYGVDPDLYLKWVKARKPKYSQVCD
jgi:hypothetical protein